MRISRVPMVMAAAVGGLLAAASAKAMIPPGVKSITPPNGATGVALDTEIRLELQTAQADPGLQLFEVATKVEVPVRLQSLEKWTSTSCSSDVPGCVQMGAHCVFRPVRVLRPNTRYMMSCRSGIPGCSGTFTTRRSESPKRHSVH